MDQGEINVECIQRRLGTGRFQLLTFVVLGLIYSRGAWHVFGIMFLAGDPGHMCALPPYVPHVDAVLSSSSPSLYSSSPLSSSSSSSSPLSNAGRHSQQTESSPNLTSNADNGMPYESGEERENMGVMERNWTSGACSLSYTTYNGSSVTPSEGCPHGWSYGSLFQQTVVSEWDLVCGRGFLVELSMTVTMVGSMVGAMVILPLSDRCGRKRVMMTCLLSQAVIGTIMAFINSYQVFIILRFIIGMLNIGVGLTSFVLMTETFPARRRTVMSIAFQVFWALGVMTVAGYGYLLRHWRHLELVLSLPNLLALPCCWLLPESLPWLISQKRWKEAEITINIIARTNKKTADDFASLTPTQNDANTNLHTLCNCCSASSANQYQNDRSAVVVSERDTMLNTEHKHLGVKLSDTIRLDEEISLDNRISDRGVESANQIKSEEQTSEEHSGKHEGNNGAEHTEQTSEDCYGKCEEKNSAEHMVHEEYKCGDNAACGIREISKWGIGAEVGVGCIQKDVEQTMTQKSYTILDLFRHRQLRCYSCVMFFLFFVNSLGYFGMSFSVPVLHGDQFVNLCIMGAVEIPANLICVIISQKIGRRYPNAMFLLLCGVSNIVAIFIPPHQEMLNLLCVMMGKFAITAAYSTIYLYSAEIFPTAVRNQAMGMSSVFENIGSISAPFLVLAAKSMAELPLVLFGALTMVGAGLTLLLPETHNRPLPQTLHDITAW